MTTASENRSFFCQHWDWLCHGPCDETQRGIVHWWEERRLSYNLLVGTVGVITWFLVLIAGSAAVGPGEDFEEPLAMLFGPLFYGIAANFCYTFGWINDVFFFRAYPRRNLFRAGLFFSLGLTALPGIWAVSAWVMAVVTGHKL